MRVINTCSGWQHEMLSNADPSDKRQEHATAVFGTEVQHSHGNNAPTNVERYATLAPGRCPQSQGDIFIITPPTLANSGVFRS